MKKYWVGSEKMSSVFILDFKGFVGDLMIGGIKISKKFFGWREKV